MSWRALRPDDYPMKVMMMKPLRPWLFALSALASPLSQPIAAAEMPAVPSTARALSPAHAQSLRAILFATNSYEHAITGMRTAKLAPEELDVQRAFSNQVTREEFNRRFVPVLGKYLGEQQAFELAGFYQSSGMRKVQEAERSRLNGKYQTAMLTMAEERALAVYQTSPNGKAMMWATKHTSEDAKELWRNWMTEYITAMNQKMARVVANGLKALEDAAERKDNKPMTLEPIGIRYMDKLALAVVNTTHRWRWAGKILERELERIGLVNVLAPENLATPQGVARGQAVVAHTEKLLEQFTAEIDAGLNERQQAFSAIALPGGGGQFAERATANLYSYFVEVGEGRRRMLDLYRRVLTLADSRQGQLKLENGKLIFPSDADAQLAIGLLDEMKALEDEISKRQEVMAERERKTLASGGAG